MIRMLAAALLASTCTALQPSGPAPAPTQDPTSVIDDVEDGGTSAPQSDCEIAFEHLADMECPPAEGHTAWLQRCQPLPTSTIDCLLLTTNCAQKRGCLEAP